MIEFSQVASLFKEMECPVCNKPCGLAPVLRCDLVDKECIPIASCHS